MKNLDKTLYSIHAAIPRKHISSLLVWGTGKLVIASTLAITGVFCPWPAIDIPIVK